LDFFQIREHESKTGTDIFPDFIVRPSSDLMIRGGSFYAVWNEKTGLWSQDEYDVQRLVDEALYAHAETIEGPVRIKVMSNYKSGSWRDFRSYIGNMPDCYRQLDSTITFANTPPRKGDYSSKRLPYPVEAGSIEAYDKLMGTLYDEDERRKLEWAIGAVISGDSTKIQKFIVLYGESGTGKSTYLNIVGKLFGIYSETFDAEALTGNKDTFGTGAFGNNPLVAIQHDADLSRIERNTTLNSIVSHESIVINPKFMKPYTAVLSAFLMIGTNKSVRITDAKSGVIRRLIDVHPSGRLLPVNDYEAAVTQVDFELGAIAHHCLEVYRQCGMHYYAQYKPMDMITRTDVFYNFVMANFELFAEQDGTTLKQAWNLYKEFCDEGRYEWRLQQHRFRDELRNYFVQFTDRGRVGEVVTTNIYKGFRFDKLGIAEPLPEPPPSLVMESDVSLLDELLAHQPAQYAKDDGTPEKPWAKVTTMLTNLDTSMLHYVKLDSPQHIVVDFDLRNDDGEKDLALNMAAASLFPATYAELSKGGSGIHLHYTYDGDVMELSNQYKPGIEVKIFRGDASLRRKLSKCNNVPIATIKGGLPHKERRMIDSETMRSERALRDLIMRNLRKEVHPGTKSSVDFIKKILDDAYESGMPYDVTEMRGRILAFANNSTNHSLECVRTVQQMKFASEAEAKGPEAEPEGGLVFYDVEVYPNLFVVCWKFEGKPTVVRMVNPAPAAIEELVKFKLLGFNNRRYDNHILYARIMGYSELDLFNLSQRLINGEKSASFGEAYNMSYGDVWEMSSKRQSLKRFQIELGLNHEEIGLPWDQPVLEELWGKVVEYCANDVVTTEQVFHIRKQDFVARQILADLSGLKVNDTTQRHTAQIIFGNDKNVQEQFVYTNLAETFPGYHYEAGHSWFMGEEVGEGGYVYAEPGMYSDVAVLDVASMHPTSIEMLDLFGPYTQRYTDLKTARIAIKRKDYKTARSLLGGALKPYLGSEDDARALADALKLAINIVYGLTSASFDNPFRDKRNKDNIVAKRGALFMVALKNAVQEKGFQVVHIKTDSIKIPHATQEIIDFIVNYGREYGYDFEHETTYSKICLVNDAVYIARSENGEWTAVGAQFAHPFVFKTLFSGEEVTFDDLCETKTVTKGALYLDFGEGGDPHFVGRAGLFVPVKEGHQGGFLLRGQDGTYHAAAGTKGFLWKEAAVVQEFEQEDSINIAYFRKLADAAVKNITRFGDIDWLRE
jgi:Family of unknown function (DUF5906)